MSTAILNSTSLTGTGYGARTLYRTSVPQPRLRLTKRGRSLLTTFASLPLAVAAFAFALNGGGAVATLEGSDIPFEYVTVESGQSLWLLAEQLAPNADPRDVIHAIVQLNGLESSDVFAGQELAIPAQYVD